MTEKRFHEEIISMRGRLYRVSCKLLRNPVDRDDAVQECMRKALQKRSLLRCDAQLEGWLTRILINECYNILRKRMREAPYEASKQPEQAAPEPDYALADAVNALDAKLRTPLVMFYYNGYSVKEISQMLVLTDGTVKGRLHRARRKLRAMLAEN